MCLLGGSEAGAAPRPALAWPCLLGPSTDAVALGWEALSAGDMSFTALG